MKKTIGLVGNGFIGKSIISFFEGTGKYNVLVYDIDPEKRNVESLSVLAQRSKIIFVAVPTPMFLETGECDTSILEGVLSGLDRVCEKHSILVKSTFPPDKGEEFQKRFKHLNLISNIEFLTERNAIEDFKNQDRIILGGRMFGSVVEMYKEVFPDVPIYKTDIKTALMVKYATNCFLATKVSFANEMYQVCEKLNIQYDNVKEMVLLDKRIGKSHLNVPCENQFGFSKSCFPKDCNAMKSLGKSLGIDTKMLDATWEKNLEVRPERDWELLENRAISKNKK